jgi:hypothetical protein
MSGGLGNRVAPQNRCKWWVPHQLCTSPLVAGFGAGTPPDKCPVTELGRAGRTFRKGDGARRIGVYPDVVNRCRKR